jgi:hypothetical protein
MDHVVRRIILDWVKAIGDVNAMPTIVS